MCVFRCCKRRQTHHAAAITTPLARETMFGASCHYPPSGAPSVMREADTDDMGIEIGGRNPTTLRYSDGITSMKRVLVLYIVDTASKKANYKSNIKKKT